MHLRVSGWTPRPLFTGHKGIPDGELTVKLVTRDFIYMHCCRFGCSWKFSSFLPEYKVFLVNIIVLSCRLSIQTRLAWFCWLGEARLHGLGVALCGSSEDRAQVFQSSEGNGDWAGYGECQPSLELLTPYKVPVGGGRRWSCALRALRDPKGWGEALVIAFRLWRDCMESGPCSSPPSDVGRGRRGNHCLRGTWSPGKEVGMGVLAT
jgi:hypothetical protein